MNEQVTESELYKELEREWEYARKQANYWNNIAVGLREKNKRLRSALIAIDVNATDAKIKSIAFTALDEDGDKE